MKQAALKGHDETAALLDGRLAWRATSFAPSQDTIPPSKITEATTLDPAPIVTAPAAGQLDQKADQEADPGKGE